jgi:hypothetical protein
MIFLRRYLHFSTIVWLSCQVASLSAFGPQNCCPAHRMLAEGEPDCHKTDDNACPMHAADGQECPAHASDGADARPCVMRGICNAPAVALASLFPAHGILTAGSHAPFDAASSLLAGSVPHLTPFVVFGDTPPPRL